MSRYLERLLIIMAWIMIFAFLNVPGRIEGKYFPVIDDVSIRIEPRDEKTSAIYLDYDKNRQCAFRNIQFYMGETRGKETQVVALDTIYAGQASVRWPGRQDDVGPFIVRATPGQLQNLAVYIEHRCHAGFLTVTRYSVKEGVAERI